MHRYCIYHIITYFYLFFIFICSFCIKTCLTDRVIKRNILRIFISVLIVKCVIIVYKLDVCIIRISITQSYFVCLTVARIISFFLQKGTIYMVLILRILMPSFLWTSLDYTNYNLLLSHLNVSCFEKKMQKPLLPCILQCCNSKLRF